MDENLKKIVLTQARAVVLEKGRSQNTQLALALRAEAAQLGFKFDRALNEVLPTLSQAEFKTLAAWLLPVLAEQVGADRSYQPLFKNFPEDVPEDRDYFLRRIVGVLQTYWLLPTGTEATTLECGCVVDSSLFNLADFGACPICQQQTAATSSSAVRSKVKDQSVKRSLKLMTSAEAEVLFQQMLGAKVAYSESTKEQVKLLLASASYREIRSWLPKEFSNKENLAVIIASLWSRHPSLVKSKWCQTATDLLRTAAAFSEGDVSLKENTKYRLKNKQRKFLLQRLAELKAPLEDMLRHRQKWLRLGEYLHAGTSNVLSVQENFKILREHPNTIPTFNRRAETAILNLLSTGEVQSALSVLVTRPGELARKVDLLLRLTKTPQVVMEAFQGVVGEIAAPLLLKLYKYLASRAKPASRRYFIPKGAVAKMKTMADERVVLPTEVIEQMRSIISQELARRYQKKGSWTKVVIDPVLKQVLAPLTLRNTTKALFTVARGSRIKFNEKAQTLRMFLYWKEGNSGRIDVDLSAMVFDQHWKYRDHLSWTSLSALGSTHSGDIQSAPMGAAEFIDLNLAACRQAGLRYVVMSVYSFTGQAFKDFESFAGIMERTHPNSGEAFEPKTVTQKFDLVGESTANLPLILDLETNELIWADLASGGGRGRYIEGETSKLSDLGQAVVSMASTSPTLYELLSLHAKARGAEIHEQKRPGVAYDEVFDLEKAKNIATLVADYI